jgi:hypothetical protein
VRLGAGSPGGRVMDSVRYKLHTSLPFVPGLHVPGALSAMLVGVR